MPVDVKILGRTECPNQKEILCQDALDFVANLHLKFNTTRKELLKQRSLKQKILDEGSLPNFLPDPEGIRGGAWKVASTPADLMNRQVEITGPTDRKMMINALNSGAKVFMADLEDALSPTWENVINGQVNLKNAIRRTIDFTSEQGKEYKLSDKTATLMVRPRGWHLEEAAVLVNQQAISASIFDFGLYFFHNAKELIERGSGPYFYLPKLENHKEARLWNSIFVEAQKLLNIPQGTIRATVLIETISAAFEMEEILYELKEHAAGLNAGRWDYIFSVIKQFRKNPSFVLPDRKQVTMEVPFMTAYANLLVQACHRHEAHAIGGMSAFIPNRKDPEVTQNAINAVLADKTREAKAGFDGTWVAHPDLVPLAAKVFKDRLQDKPHQKDIKKSELRISANELIRTTIEGAKITEDGLRTNARVAIQYIGQWLNGHGAVAINNLMEDAATAEISRAQLWQWLQHRVHMEDGRPITPELYRKLKQDELRKLDTSSAGASYIDAAEILDQLVLSDNFEDFLTIAAYKQLQMDL